MVGREEECEGEPREARRWKSITVGFFSADQYRDITLKHIYCTSETNKPTKEEHFLSVLKQTNLLFRLETVK